LRRFGLRRRAWLGRAPLIDMPRGMFERPVWAGGAGLPRRDSRRATGYIPDVPSGPATSRRAGDAAGAFAAPLLAAIAGAFVFRGTLAYDFSQDDFLGLARASGLAPRLTGVWRYLSHQAFFDLMRPAAGLNAAPYHAVSLAAHTACAALVAVVLGRVASRPATLLGAVFFAVHPALFSAVYWISAIGDSLALMAALGALLLALRGDRLRWASLPLFGLSLLAKESTLLLPAVVWLVARTWRPAPRGTGAVVIGLGAIAALHLIASAGGDAFGVRSGLPGEAAYSIGFGTHLGANALTYLGWTANFFLPTLRGFGDAVDTAVFPWAIALLVLWLTGLASRGLRERGWVAGGAAFALFLLPVLPLRHHTYHYYLYAPLVGAAWCLAAGFDLALSRRGGRTAWRIAAACAALLTINGAIVVRKVETEPFVLPDLRADPTVDRARIAANVRESLAGYTAVPGETLLFWSPIGASMGSRGETLETFPSHETYWERNVRGALLDGLAVRVMVPGITAVRFVRVYEPARTHVRYAVYRPDGRLMVATPAKVDSFIRAQTPPR
jgi:hypothetical protein